MRKSARLFGLVIFLSLTLAGGVVFATGGTTAPPTKANPPTTVTPTNPSTPVGKPQPQGPCCIAGKYDGFRKDIPSKTCPKPGEGKFIMEISQDSGCGSKISGKVTDPKDGSTQNFEGTVTQREKCCYIQGTMKKPAAATGAPGEETKFSGLLCKKDVKWSGKGNYTTTRSGVSCSGTWEMKQM